MFLGFVVFFSLGSVWVVFGWVCGCLGAWMYAITYADVYLRARACLCVSVGAVVVCGVGLCGEGWGLAVTVRGLCVD